MSPENIVPFLLPKFSLKFSLYSGTNIYSLFECADSGCST